MASDRSSSRKNDERQRGKRARKAGPSAAGAGGARRADLLEALHAAGRAQSAATVMFHTALAATLDLSATEEKALDLLGRAGPMTASDLAAGTGLARASITALVDRLERKAFARRVPHPTDGRSVLVEAGGDRVAQIAPLFADWADALDALYAGYSDAELAIILRFLRETTERQHAAATKLTQEQRTRRGVAG